MGWDSRDLITQADETQSPHPKRGDDPLTLQRQGTHISSPETIKIPASTLVSLRLGCLWQDYILGTKSFPGTIATPPLRSSPRKGKKAASPNPDLPGAAEQGERGPGLDGAVLKSSHQGARRTREPSASGSGQREGGPLSWAPSRAGGPEVVLKAAPGQGTLRVMDSQLWRCPSWKGLRMGTFLHR